MEIVGGWEVFKVAKVSQILGIINTIASFHTFEGSVKSGKCVQMVSFRKFFVGIWATGG